MRKICVAILVSLILLCASCACAEFKIGDIITFGEYEQDNNIANGKEPIEWEVVDIDKSTGNLKLLSRYLLDCVVYNNTTRKTKWKDTTLGQWMNTTFLNTAFNEVERLCIVPTVVYGNNWKVYIPDETDLKRMSTFRCPTTQYAKARGVDTRITNGLQMGSYWLRMNESSTNGVWVGINGTVYKKGNAVTNASNGVRPMMWLSPDYDQDTPGANAQDMRLMERITFDNVCRVQLLSYDTQDFIGVCPTGRPTDYSQVSQTGANTQYMIMKVAVTNKGNRMLDLMDSSVMVDYDNGYQYGGWWFETSQQEGYMLSSQDTTKSLLPGQSVVYIFGCAVPNGVLYSDGALSMVFDICGNQVVYHIR